jgi:hypothetical protein
VKQDKLAPGLKTSQLPKTAKIEISGDQIWIRSSAARCNTRVAHKLIRKCSERLVGLLVIAFTSCAPCSLGSCGATGTVDALKNLHSQNQELGQRGCHPSS